MNILDYLLGPSLQSQLNQSIPKGGYSGWSNFRQPGLESAPPNFGVTPDDEGIIRDESMAPMISTVPITPQSDDRWHPELGPYPQEEPDGTAQALPYLDSVRMMTDVQKKQLIELHDLDPNVYTINKDGYITRGPTNTQPTSSSMPEAIHPKNSATSAFLKSAAEAAPSTLAAGAGAGLMTSQLNPLAHVLSPYSEILSGIIGATAGGLGARKLQSAIEPESMQQNVAEAQQEHPLASKLGELSTIPFGGFVPSPAGLGRAGAGLVKSAIGQDLTERELQSLINTGIGAAIPPVQGIAQNLVQGQGMPSAKELMEQAAIGAVFNKPWALGRAMGFHDTDIVDEPTREMLQKQTGQVKTVPETPLKMAKVTDISTVPPATTPVEASTEKQTDRAEDEKIQREMRKKSQGMVFSEESALPGEGNTKYQEWLTYLRKLIKERADIAETIDPGNPSKEAMNRLSDINDELDNLKGNYPEFVKAWESSGVGKPFRIGPDLGKQSTETKTPETIENPKTQFQQEQTARTKAEPDLPTQPDEGGMWLNFFKKLGLVKRNYETEYQEKLNVGDRNVAGLAVIKEGLKGLVKLSSKDMGADTPGHEAGHIFARTLENSPRAKDQQFWEKYQSHIEDLPDYQRWSKERAARGLSNTPEEYIMTDQGVESWKRAVDNEPGYKKFWNDITSYIKTRYGEHADTADYRRMLNYKLLHDPSYERLFGTQGAIRTAAVSPIGKEPNKDWQVTIQEPQTLKIGTKSKTIPGYVQIDDISGGENNWSKSPETLRKEGYNIPDFTGAKSGKYKMSEFLSGEKPTTSTEPILQEQSALPKGEGEQRVLPPAFTEDSVRDVLANTKTIISALEKKRMSRDSAEEMVDALLTEYNWDKLPETKEFIETDLSAKPDSHLNWKAFQQTYAIETGKLRGKNIGETVAPKPLATEAPTVKTPTTEELSVTTKGKTKVEPNAAPPEKVFSKVSETELAAPKSESEQLARLTKVKEGWAHVDNPDISMQEKAGKLMQEYIEAHAKNDTSMMTHLEAQYDYLIRKNPELRTVEKMAPTLAANPQVKREVDVRPKVTPGDKAAQLRYGKNYNELSDAQKAVIDQETHRGVGENLATHATLPKLNSRLDELLKSINTPTALSHWGIKLFRTQLDSIRKSGGPEGELIATALEKYYSLKDKIYGEGFTPILKASKGLSKEDINKVENVLIAEDREKADNSHLLTAKQKVLYDAVRDSLKQVKTDQLNANQPETVRVGGKALKVNAAVKPWDYPNRINPKVLETLIEKPTSQAATNLKDDFITHQITLGKGRAEATQQLNAILNAYEKNSTNLNKFRAIREAEGTSLPDSWMRNGLLRNLNSYFNRVSADRAYHDTIESQADVGKAVGLGKDVWGNPYVSTSRDISGNPDVRAVMERLHGEGFDPADRKVKLANRIATALMLGPLTNIHIAASSVFNGLQYAGLTEAIPAAVHGLTNLKTSLEHSLQTGYNRKNFSSFRDIYDNQLTGLEKMQGWATAIGNLSGRDATNTLTKSYLQGMGEYLIRQKALAANGGDKTAIDLMKRVDPDWVAGKTYTGSDLNQIASTFAGIIHGAHDVRTLPGWMLKDTSMQPFFSLMSWSIAQTNAWMRHVWTPATKGNFTPLIMSTFGSLLGGAIISQARELLSDKKSPIPSFEEMVQSERGLEGNIPNAAYKAMALSSYVGFAGMLSVAGKAIEDVAHKNLPQGAVFPIEELISNPVDKGAKFIQAAMTDPNFDWARAIPRFMLDNVKDNFQLGRIVTTWMANAAPETFEQQSYSQELNKKTSQLRRWKMVEGQPYEAQSISTANPYEDMTMKHFKHTEDLTEAAEELPSLFQAAIEESHGNMDTLRAQFKKIKTNSYETMPNPESIPRSFLSYLNFVTKTQGSAAAADLVNDYFLRNTLNKAKSAMVPSL